MKYHEKRNYDGLEMYQCRYEKEWTVLQKIVVASILMLSLLGAGMAEKYFLGI